MPTTSGGSRRTCCASSARSAGCVLFGDQRPVAALRTCDDKQRCCSKRAAATALSRCAGAGAQVRQRLARVAGAAPADGGRRRPPGRPVAAATGAPATERRSAAAPSETPNGHGGGGGGGGGGRGGSRCARPTYEAGGGGGGVHPYLLLALVWRHTRADFTAALRSHLGRGRSSQSPVHHRSAIVGLTLSLFDRRRWARGATGEPNYHLGQWADSGRHQKPPESSVFVSRHAMGHGVQESLLEGRYHLRGLGPRRPHALRSSCFRHGTVRLTTTIPVDASTGVVGFTGTENDTSGRLGGLLCGAP